MWWPVYTKRVDQRIKPQMPSVLMTDRYTHKPSTVTLAHARWELINNPSFWKWDTTCVPTWTSKQRSFVLGCCHFLATILHKRDDFNFLIFIFPYMSTSHRGHNLVRIGCVCDTYEDFSKQNMLITTRLIKQSIKLVKCFKKEYCLYVCLSVCYRSSCLNQQPAILTGLS